MKSVHLNKFVFVLALVVDVFAYGQGPSFRGIHYPTEHEYSQDCQSDHSQIRGVCKKYSECPNAQKMWTSARIFPSLCYYNKFDSIVCCLDEKQTSNIPFPLTLHHHQHPDNNSGGKISTGTSHVPEHGHQHHHTANNQFPIPSPSTFPHHQYTNTNHGGIVSTGASYLPAHGHQNHHTVNNQFSIPSPSPFPHHQHPNSNSAGPIITGANHIPEHGHQNHHTGNTKFHIPSQPTFPHNQHSNTGVSHVPGSLHQNHHNTNNQLPGSDSITNSGNNKIVTPHSNTNKFPIGTQIHPGNFPNTQFPTGNFPHANNQFPNFGNGQPSFPNTNNQFPFNTGNNQGNFPSTDTQFPIFGSGQQNRPNANTQFPVNQNQFPGFGNSQQNPPNINTDQGNFPNTNNQFPIFSNGQSNRPNANNQFPINQGNNQFPTNQENSFPNTNNQFPVFGNGQENNNNQFPQNIGNNAGNFPNTNNQFPIFSNTNNQSPGGQRNRPNVGNNQFPINQANTNSPFPNFGIVPQTPQNQENSPQNNNNQFPITTPDLSDCTVVVIQDPNNPVDSRCAVPDPNQNQNNQNQFGTINSQNRQPISDSIPQQDQPISQAASQPKQDEEEEEYKPPRISQDVCESVYDVTSLVGGEPTEIGQYPFMAAIGWKRVDDKLEFKCGGFLLSRTYVLTAAHCATLGGDKPVAVRTGGINLDNATSSDLDIPIEDIIVHPKYDDKQTYNDIALMKLSRRAKDEFACLWQKDKVDKEYEEVKAIGYGHTNFGGPHSNSLLQIKLKLFDNKQCSPYYPPEARFPNGIIDSQICSGDLARAKDTCQGDSGGPIFIERRSTTGILTPIVIGITSFGQGCAGEAPSLYTRISSYLDWIEPIVWPNL